MDGRLRVLTLVVGIVLMHAPLVEAAFPKPIHTNHTRFRIPFKFDAAALDRMDTREVQLHVSRDHGATWELAQTLTPQGGKFEYQSTADGEYWFSVKTLDGRNQLHPPRGAFETGLIVVVDTTAPALELSLKQEVTGKLHLSWRATDESLDISTLRLEYLAPDAQDWEPISLVPQTSGDTSWTLNHAGVVSVRGSVSDSSGNSVETKTQLDLGGPVDRGAKQRSTRRGPIAEMPQDDGLDSANTPPPVKTEPIASLPPNPAMGEEQYQGPVITPQGSLRKYQRSGESTNANSRPDNVPERWSTVPAGTESLTAPLQTSTIPAARSNQVSPQFVSRQVPATEPAPRRAVPRQRLVTSRRFQIEYSLVEVGPSGISAVELFITEDNGRKWWKYGDDADQKSPFDVEVPRDGNYGFAIGVRSGAGLASDPPLPGQAPTFNVAVDQTPPTVELFPLQQGKGANSNRLLIHWKVTEDHPAEKPISLFYATNLNGPWESISGWKEDLNSSYEWTVGPAVPAHFHVRVMVRDAAGNVTQADTPAPIVVDVTQPTARIVDVEAPTSSLPQ